MSDRKTESSGPGVALLFEDANLSAHLREALVEAGARIVHEGPATQATREDLSGNGADVVVVNLDDKVEAHLDDLYEIFDESSQRVVFNDAEASSGLSGWDQARWARHLAAKLMNAVDVDPPRPAEARPVETQPTELTLPEDEMPEAPPEEDAPAGDMSSSSHADQAVDLTQELEALLAEDGDLLGHGDDDDVISPRREIDLDLGEVDLGDAGEDARALLQSIPADPDAEASDASSDEASAMPETSGGPEPTDSLQAMELSGDEALDDGFDLTYTAGDDAGAGESGITLLDAAEGDEPATAAETDDDSAFEETLRQFDEALAEAPDAATDDPHADAEALFKGVAGDDDTEAGVDVPADVPAAVQDSAEPASEPASTLSLADPDSDMPVAEPDKPVKTISADAGSAFSLADPDSEMPHAAPEATVKPVSIDAGNAFTLVDEDDDSPADPTAGNKPSVAAPESPDWGLVDFDGVDDDDDDDKPVPSPSGLEIMQQNKKPKAVDPSEFGIEKMSANEYLSPESEGGDGDIDIEPSMSLELESIEEAVAPKMADDGGELYDAGSSIRRVVVVAAGASKESRASLSAFLGAVGGVPNAAIIGIVHQSANEDLGALASECNSTSPIMPVRVPEAEGTMRNGEMILVPAGKLAQLQADGTLTMRDGAALADATPSIDKTLTLLSVAFKDKLVAIVLAGDAVDALAGAETVKQAGGKVWAVHPADYNDNTMAAVIAEQQLAEQTGTPQELAALMLKELT